MQGILPPEIYLHEVGKYAYMNAVKDSPSYRVLGSMTAGTVVSVDELDIIRIIKAREGVSLKRGLTGVETTDFWTMVFDTIDACINNPVADGCYIEQMNVWLQADVSILAEPVPIGLHNSSLVDEEEEVRQLIWGEWKEGGNQPIKTSIDGTKVILRTDINNQCVTMQEIMVLKAYRDNNPELNITMLVKPEVLELINSEAYN